jgi:mono/diheme cytochrome c family protein
MLLTFAPLVAGLSTGHEIGLALVAAAFIVFALVSSFVLSGRNPDFPGKRLGLYVVVTICFFAAMIAAVLVFGRESPEAKGAPETTAQASPSTTTAPSTTTSGGGGGAGAVQGDPVAGKEVFTSASCSGCHTLKAARATGTVGPNLDQLKPAYDKIVHQVEVGGGPMPAFKGQLTDKQIHDVAAFVYTSTH